MKKCEERQEKILQYMKDTIRERCFPPTVREICAALDIKSTSTVFKDLKVLEEKGLIRKDPSKPRALVVVDRNPPEPHNDIPTSIDDTNTTLIPIIGRVAAGTRFCRSRISMNTFPSLHDSWEKATISSFPFTATA